MKRILSLISLPANKLNASAVAGNNPSGNSSCQPAMQCVSPVVVYSSSEWYRFRCLYSPVLLRHLGYGFMMPLFTTFLRKACGTMLVFVCSVTVALSQIPDDNPIPQEPKKLKPEEAIKADTMPKAVRVVRDSLPGGLSDSLLFTREQDLEYLLALQRRIPPSVRLALDSKRALTNLEIVRRRLQQESPWQAAMRNMQVSDQIYLPDATENVQRQVAIANATNVPVFKPAQIGGMSATLGQIGSFLGLIEDVSPRLRYSVYEEAPVTVVVYSTAAVVVATLVKKTMPPGTYEVTWNGLDDKGHDLGDGDYVIEARIGTDRFVRKRVLIGSNPYK